MTTSTPRWTAETEATATRALWEHGHLGSPLDEATERDEPAAVAFTRGAVRAVLDSLARSGVLTAVGGETRQEIEVQSGRVHYPCSDLPRAWRQYGGLRAEGKPAKVVTRTVILTPWREVTDEPAA